MRQVVDTMHIPVVDLAGYEADDVLATLATKAAAAGDDVIVVTGDRDTYQLVEDPHIRVLYNRRGVSDYVLYDEAGIVERTGVTPAQYPEFAALRGDPSDNLPGVPGVGEKTAAKLITTYGGLDAIYAHLDELTPRLREALEAGEESVRSQRQGNAARTGPARRAGSVRGTASAGGTWPNCAGCSTSWSSAPCGTASSRQQARGKRTHPRRAAAGRTTGRHGRAPGQCRGSRPTPPGLGARGAWRWQSPARGRATKAARPCSAWPSPKSGRRPGGRPGSAGSS